MADDTKTFKDVALRAVGRTVVDFQRLEHNLKLVAHFGPMEGVLLKVQRDIERLAKKASSYTLGQAVRAWLGAIEGDIPRHSHTPDLFEQTLQTTVSLRMDSETQKAHGDALLALLESRNELIHGGLVKFDWESQDECAKLIARLDDVNDKIRIQMDFFVALMKGMQEIRAKDVLIAETATPGVWSLVSQIKIDA